MGQRGPKPLPAEVKRRRGSHEKLPAPVVSLAPAVEAEPPEGLGEGGRVFWSTVRREAGGWLAASDMPLLYRCAQAWDRMDALQRAVDEGSAKRSDLRALEAQWTRWVSLLGLSPSDRAALAVEVTRANSKLDDVTAAKARVRTGS